MPRAGLDSKLIEQQLDDQKKKKALAEQAAKLVDVRMQIKGFDAKAWLIETLKSKIPHPLSPPLPSSDVCAAGTHHGLLYSHCQFLPIVEQRTSTTTLICGARRPELASLKILRQVIIFGR